jgi:aryl-alcohol dehydrogenase-like predicted oxidoreductase
MQEMQFAAGFPKLEGAGFYRMTQGSAVSSLGIGSYLGAMDDETDRAYIEAMCAAVRGGINFIDTSLNYRHQRFERNIGAALQQLFREGVDRADLMVCTKAGFLVPNAIPAGLSQDDIAGGMHSMAPAFLFDQCQRSRKNLGLETLDVLYLHNPETQLRHITRGIFDDRLRRAFELLENLAAKNQIRFYGAATWDGFRKPAGHAEGLSLGKIVELASQAGGKNHHFRFIQLPVNLAMREAFTLKNEQSPAGMVTTLDAAEWCGITAIASASLMQARLSRGLPDEVSEHLPGLQTDAQRALQFARSVPGVTVALCGMSHAAHVTENLRIAAVPAPGRKEFLEMFQPSA